MPFFFFSFLGGKWFCPRTSGTEEFVPEFLFLPLSRDKGTVGQGNIFVPSLGNSLNQCTVSIFVLLSIKFDALTIQPTRKLCLQFDIWNFQLKWYQVFAAAWRNKPPLELEGSKIASTSLFTNFEILNFQSSLLGLLYRLSLLWQAWWPNLPTILCSIKWILLWCLQLHQVSMWCMNLDMIKYQSLWRYTVRFFCPVFVKVRRYFIIFHEHNLWSA